MQNTLKLRFTYLIGQKTLQWRDVKYPSLPEDIDKNVKLHLVLHLLDVGPTN